MKEPSMRFLIELAKALEATEHRNVAEAMCAGMLWAMYPEWWDKIWIPQWQQKRATK
jgi:hypothetical protein